MKNITNSAKNKSNESKQLGVFVNLGSQSKSDPDNTEAISLMENIEYYRKLMGWTQKRIYLMGAAAMIGKDNPALVHQIAEYISGVRPKQFVTSKESEESES